MYRLRSFLIARQVVETVDEMWNFLTQDEWAWIRRGRDAGGYGIETPDAAQVVFGEAALTGAVGIAARSLGDPGAPESRTLAFCPIDGLIEAFAAIRAMFGGDPRAVARVLQAKFLDDQRAAAHGVIDDWFGKVAAEVERRSSGSGPGS